MRVLVTGSSGPDRHEPCACACIADGHSVFGVDKRLNTWTRRRSTRCSRTSPATTRRSAAESTGSSTPRSTSSSTSRRTRRCTSSSAQPQRALENAMMTFNVLEYCRALGLPLVFSSTREVYGDVHRFEEYGEATADFAYTESPYSASKITLGGVHLLLRQVLRAQVPRLPLLERLRPLRQRPPADGAGAAALHAPAAAAASRSPSSAATTRCSTSPTSTTASTGIVRGIEGLGGGQVTNETINLAYGAGQHARPRRRADRRRRSTSSRRSPTSLRCVGEVTHYVADIRKARELLDWQPADAARRGHPERGRLVPRMARPRIPRRTAPHRGREPARRGRARLQAARQRSRLALRRPSRSSARPRRARAPSRGRCSRRLDARGRLGRLGGALRRHPDRSRRRPTTRPGSSASSRSTHDVSVGEYQRLAHAAIDEIARERAHRRSSSAARGSTSARRSSSLELPPPPAPGAREDGAASTTSSAPEAAHALLAERDPVAAARVHPNDRRRVVRALELAESGRSLAPDEDRLWSDDVRHPTLLVGLELPLERARRAHRGAASRRWLAAGAVAEAAAAWARPALGDRAQGARARGSSRPCRAARRSRPSSLATRRLARYQRKWLRRLPVAATLDAGRPPEEIADEIVALAGAGERLPGR